MNAMKFHEDIARRKLGVVPEWLPCVWERIGPDACRLDGAIPRLLQRGPRKGQPTWKGMKLSSCIITDAEADQERATYETQTGNCADCQGEKKTPWGWSSDEGAKYRACQKCNGTGTAQGKSEVQK